MYRATRLHKLCNDDNKNHVIHDILKKYKNQSSSEVHTTHTLSQNKHHTCISLQCTGSQDGLDPICHVGEQFC